MKNEITSKEAALNLAVKSGLEAVMSKDHFRRAFGVADAVSQLRTLLDRDAMASIMSLQGSQVGFRTDKDTAGGYPLPVVKDCMIEALMTGVYPVGNQFNIIAGRAYITKEGFGHLLKSCGVQYTITTGIPVIKSDKGATVEATIEWIQGGEPKTKKLELAIRVNAGMGADAIIGKATRKARAWLYNTYTGMDISDGEIEDKDAVSPIKSSRFSKDSAVIDITPEPATENETGAEKLKEIIEKKKIPLEVKDFEEYCEGRGEVFEPEQIIPVVDLIAENILKGGNQ